MARTAYATTILLVLLLGTILLQIFLSKRESKWPGLVLPVITFLCSVLMVLNVTVMESVRAAIAAAISALIAGNIPTLILLAIYFSCRSKVKRKSEVEKMHISDL
jgi:cadmium resistance protein CadD (predicted permease)